MVSENKKRWPVKHEKCMATFVYLDHLEEREESREEWF